MKDIVINLYSEFFWNYSITFPEVAYTEYDGVIQVIHTLPANGLHLSQRKQYAQEYMKKLNVEDVIKQLEL